MYVNQKNAGEKTQQKSGAKDYFLDITFLFLEHNANFIEESSLKPSSLLLCMSLI